MDRQSRAALNAETRRMWVILGLLALCLAAALPLFAETDSSLLSRAATVGSWEALRSNPGLDVRDGSNRPVSTARLERSLSAASRRLRWEVAAFSSLPRMRAWLIFLDQNEFLLAALRPDGWLRFLRETVLSCLPLRSPKAHVSSTVLRLALACSASLLALSFLQLTYAPGRILALVLRC